VRRLVHGLLLLGLTQTGLGCAVQAAPGVHFPTRGRHVPSLELGLRYTPARRSGMYGGLDATVADPAPNADFSLREVALGSGYHLAVKRVAFELGPRLGLGQPAFVVMKGTGMHMAVELTLLVRLLGDNDERVGYIPVATRLDLYAFVRSGVWARPHANDAQEVIGAALGVGLRFGLASDVISEPNTGWKAP
jgi:hypothetical protein